jgi:hypothetical protein
MSDLAFEWDEAKDLLNQKQHGVSFTEARTVFYDENGLEYFDPDHSDDEDRFLLLGLSSQERILFVCHCYRASEDVIRLISARKATKKERALYPG